MLSPARYRVGPTSINGPTQRTLINSSHIDFLVMTENVSTCYGYFSIHFLMAAATEIVT